MGLLEPLRRPAALIVEEGALGVGDEAIKDLDLAGKRVLHARRLQRADQERHDHRRHAHPRVAADDPVRARAGRDRSSSLASRAAEGQAEPGVLAGAGRRRGCRELLGRPVEFAEDCIGDAGEGGDRAGAANGGRSCCSRTCASIAEEEKNDAAFAQQLASLADVYVNDAFGSAHRAHASTEGIVASRQGGGRGPADGGGARVSRRVLEHPDRPFVAILGGAKVSDKIEVIENLLPRVDALLIGGAMAYTFFKARGVPVGKSLVEDDLLDAARDVEAQAQGARPAARAARRSRRRAEARGRRASRDAGGRRPGDRRSHGPRHRPEDDRDAIATSSPARRP